MYLQVHWGQVTMGSLPRNLHQTGMDLTHTHNIAYSNTQEQVSECLSLLWMPCQEFSDDPMEVQWEQSLLRWYKGGHDCRWSEGRQVEFVHIHGRASLIWWGWLNRELFCLHAGKSFLWKGMCTMASQDIYYAKHCEVYNQITDLQASHMYPMRHVSSWEEQEQRETEMAPDFSVSFWNIHL